MAFEERSKVKEDEEYAFHDAEIHFDLVPKYAGTSTFAFSRLLALPPEILTAIVENALSTHDITVCPSRADIDFLHNVRLVHPILARLSYVRRRLFNTIWLTPNPDKLRALERHSSTICPQVRRIELRQALLHREDLPPNREKDTPLEPESSLTPRITRAVQSGRALTTWTNVMRQCRRVEAFNMETLAASTNDLIVCGPSAHALLKLVLQALAASKSQPRFLTLQHDMDLVWVHFTVPEWNEVDLSCLQYLSVVFKMECLSIDYLGGNVFYAETAAVSSLLMNRALQTLRHLSLSIPDTHTTANDLFHSPPRLPALTSLELSGYAILNNDFALWILRTPTLRRVSLTKIFLSSLAMHAELEDWHPVFSAFRDHPSGLLVELHRMYLPLVFNLSGFVTLRHQIPREPKYEEQEHTAVDEFAEMLKLYMSGLDEWEGVQESWAMAVSNLAWEQGSQGGEEGEESGEEDVMMIEGED